MTVRQSAAFGLLLAGGFAALPAFAQTASQITPPTYAPPPPTATAPVTIPEGNGPTAPAGAATTMVSLSGVTVDGAPIDPALLEQLRNRLVGHPVSVAEIFAAAHETEAAMARSGAVLSRIVVPAQSLADGAVLHLSVVAGFIERIDTSQLPPSVRRRIAAVLAPLVGDHALTFKALERRLLLAADTPGVTLRSALAAGAQPGGSVLTVEAVARPVTGFVTVDNTLPSALGREAEGIGIDLNSLAGLGENIYLRASGDLFAGNGHGFFEGTPRNRALAAGLIVPIGIDGLTVNIEGTDARTATEASGFVPGIGSRFQRLSGRIRYPFVRSRALTLSGQVSFDVQSERVRVIDPILLPISRDRLRIARGDVDLTSFLPGGAVVTADLRASFGINGLGARSAADATASEPLSRQGADAGFSKLELFASYDQPLATHVAFALRGHAQTSFGDPLLNAEQIGLATIDGLSAYSAGTVLGDAGYVGRAELRLPFVTTLGIGSFALTPYGFGAVGGVRYEQPTALERRDTTLDAYGAGLRLAATPERYSRPSVAATVEYARGHREGIPGETDRFTFTVIAQF